VVGTAALGAIGAAGAAEVAGAAGAGVDGGFEEADPRLEGGCLGCFSLNRSAVEG
jgi:hypothetical protein